MRQTTVRMSGRRSAGYAGIDAGRGMRPRRGPGNETAAGFSRIRNRIGAEDDRVNVNGLRRGGREDVDRTLGAFGVIRFEMPFTFFFRGLRFGKMRVDQRRFLVMPFVDVEQRSVARGQKQCGHSVDGGHPSHAVILMNRRVEVNFMKKNSEILQE
jgi:hypothetical protein